MGKLKIGIFGAGRGFNLSKNFMLLNCDIVALCDKHKERREAAAKQLGGDVACYESFDEFINHDMDAVIVANDFHEHTPFVIECFKRNIHVFCECISNITMAEGVELIREFEKSKSIFMLAENYPDMIFNREMKRIVDSGTLGKVVYAEGEYNHPVSAYDKKFMKTYNYYEKHWRNFLPRSYYLTHSLGPIMRISGATPVRVACMNSYAPNTSDVPTACYVGDVASTIITTNNDGSVFRFTGCAKFGAHHHTYRICGTKGQIENLRGMGNKVMLRYNEWDKPEGMPAENLYEPKWNDPDEHLIWQGGHGGGDFITSRTFVNAVLEGKQPPHPYDIHSAVTMSSVAILAHRSALEGGMPYDIPDFHKEEDRKKYENDHLSPFWGKNGEPPTLPCCSNPDYKPTEKQLELYRALLNEPD
ncbi:MAG: Gfo/Idh/MocA family oxidoreductase [Clostridia bacterium]|nr:Gfo/Idh/MocA family oxidoreductase [Clostridia bacterium]